MSRIIHKLTRPTDLLWWEWGRLMGALALVMLLLLPVCPPLVLGLVLHLALDFTLQSDEVAARKGERGHYLFIHALITGGIPGLMAGLSAEGLLWGICALVIGVLSHYIIDFSRKFGIESMLGVCLDQAAHVAVLVLIVSIGGF